MIRHLFKIIWNRKRINLLITIEIFLSFIVLFAVTTTVVFYVDRFNKPIGFNSDNVWRVQPDSKMPFGKQFEARRREGKNQLLLAMKNLPEIESIAGSTSYPYSNSTSITGFQRNGKDIDVEIGDASDDFIKVFDLHVIQGRWFDKTDDASTDLPLVINSRLSHQLYGDASPLGQYLDSTEFAKGRIIGVIDEFRKGGEFYNPNNFVFRRLRMDDTAARAWWGFVVKLREGTNASFQGKLNTVLAATEKGWSFDIGSIKNLRDENFQKHFAPIIAMALIAFFLLIMVGLGLIGVLWQNVSQRTREIGLRRAIGGTAQMVYRQILGELLVIATLGILAATILVMQAPLLNLIAVVRTSIFLTGLGISLVLMYLLTFVCGLYPSWLAMEIHPSEALHYE